MAFIDVWNAANETTFQGRCWVALWTIAGAIVRGDTVTNDSGTNLGTAPNGLNYASKVLRKQQTLTSDVLALQILRNVTIATDPAAALDSDIEWQLKEVYLDLIGIG